MKSNTENMSKREKNKNNFIINIEKKENSEEFLKFCKKCQELKTKTKNLLDNKTVEVYNIDSLFRVFFVH